MPGANAMPSRMTAKKKDGSATPRKMRGFSVRYADNGGAIVTHDMDSMMDGPYRPDPQHVFSTPAEVHAHIKSIYPIPDATPRGKRANIQEPGEQA